MKKRLFKFARWSLVIAALMVGLAACRGGNAVQTAEDVTFELIGFEPEVFAVGEVTITLQVFRGDQPLPGAQVEVQGDMNHAGMVPVQASGQTDGQGMVSIPFEWTMGGDWIITVTITTPEGQKRAGQFELQIPT